MIELSFNAHRKMHYTARAIAMSITKEINDRTPRAKVTAFIREYLNIPHGSDDSVVEFFIQNKRTAYASAERVVSIREYKPDMAMIHAARRVAHMPVPISMGRQA